MSKVFKRPKTHPQMGNDEARLIRYARSIKNQAQLDQILLEATASGVAPAQQAAWLESALPHLPFKIDGLSKLDFPCTISDVTSS